MAALVTAMAREWEVAVHNATVAQQALSYQQQQQASAAAEATKTVEKVGQEETAEDAAPEGMHLVEDLVSGIREKPKEP